jgi:poly(A) polymerase
MTPREFATEVVVTLRAGGHEAYFAGGCVRDQFLGLEPDDFDVATSAHPDQVQKLFPRSIAVGAAFGVIEVLGPKPHKVQVATFRSDGPYSDARRPDHVVYSSVKEDAERRDFTINGMFFDPLSDKLIDYVGGEKDLAAKLLRAIGDPAARFREDRLRLLRAVRFAARFGLTIEPATWGAVKSMAAEVVSVSGERIAEELRKLLVHPSRTGGVQLLIDSGLLKAVLPEVVQPNCNALGRLQSPTFPLAFAVLLAQVQLPSLGEPFERLRLSNSERDQVRWLVKHQSALLGPAKLSLHVLKPLLAHAGIDDLLAMYRAFEHDDAATWCAAKLRDWPREKIEPPPLITGDDLVADGLKPGPTFKTMLDAVRNAQLDERITTREQALAMVNSALGKSA